MSCCKKKCLPKEILKDNACQNSPISDQFLSNPHSSVVSAKQCVPTAEACSYSPKKGSGEFLPFHWAVSTGKHQVLEFTLENAAFNVNSKSKKGKTALGIAIELNGEDAAQLVQSLLDNGANPNILSFCDATPTEKYPLELAMTIWRNECICAGEGKVVKIVSSLLQHGANPNISVFPSEQWLPVLSLNQLDEQVEGNNHSDASWNLISLAISKMPADSSCQEIVDVVEALLQHGADPNKHAYPFSSLEFAVMAFMSGVLENFYQVSLVEVIKMLLMHGADPNRQIHMGEGTVTNVLWLILGGMQTHTEAKLLKMVMLLLEYGANPRSEISIPGAFQGNVLQFALENNFTEAAHLFEKSNVPFEKSIH